MSSIRKVTVVCLVVAALIVFPTARARAEYCCFNPLALPFMVAGAVVGTAAAITTGILGFPYYAYGAPYYGPGYYGSSYYYGPRYYDYGYYAPGPVFYGSGYYGPRYYGSRYYGHRYYGRGYYGSRYHGSGRAYYRSGPVSRARYYGAYRR